MNTPTVREGLTAKHDRAITEERRARRFSGLLEDHRAALSGRDTMANDDRANRLPLPESRELYRWADSDHQHNWIARSWAGSVEDAARDLHNLVTIHDNGGTASSPKKIKNAARELLRLLGED
jgi:hypothetical protein